MPEKADQLPPFRRVTVRPVHTAAAENERARSLIEPLVEIEIEGAGATPHRALVDEGASRDVVSALAESAVDLPRLRMADHHGAIDVRLDDHTGTQIKSGIVVLKGPAGEVVVPLDPFSRRFRVGSLTPGEYRLHAGSAGSGETTQTVVIRRGDVTRLATRLDGAPAHGVATVSITVRGTRAEKVRVRATDRDTGHVVFDEAVPVRSGAATLKGLAVGKLHLDVIDAAGARGCYDADPGSSQLATHLNAQVDLTPRFINQPDPPDERFGGLAPHFRDLRRVLPLMGVRTVDELASLEGEDLMHRSKSMAVLRDTPVSGSLLAEAIEDARRLVGISRVAGEHQNELRLAADASFHRTFLPAGPGRAVFEVQLPEGSTADLRIDAPSGTEDRVLTGSTSFHVDFTAQDIAEGKQLHLTVKNAGGSGLFGSITGRFPDGIGSVHLPTRPTTRDNIETIYRAAAGTNPGLETTVVDSAMMPENIRIWLDRARMFLTAAGICSIDDLGTFRLKPNGILHPGVYVAPNRPTIDLSTVAALSHYAFAGVINNSILHYLPNDVLHDTAVVMAGTWDISNQAVVIGNDVRELVVIARSITYTSSSYITWQTLPLAEATVYFPPTAADGANGSVAGERGHNGESGDADPHPSHNGGTNADTPAPFITMYILDATKNLPPIYLFGQEGGFGGRGQNGGRGGNGAQGVNADSTTFGCCRAVGWGGDGGTGGASGRGGQGGRGGKGGAITLLTSDASIAVLADRPPEIHLTPGRGGIGGFDGTPGKGGDGGPAGSDDCQVWCASHPERHGAEGGDGSQGPHGRMGDPGPPIVSDAFQIYPLTEAQWTEVFNMPHILHVSPLEVEPGENVTITGANFAPGSDKIFFDGVQQPDSTAQVSTTTTAAFKVPLDAEGGTHPLMIRPAGATSRRSNKVMLRVLPKLDHAQFSPEPRWAANTQVTLHGWAFLPGCKVVAQDNTGTKPSFNLGVVGTTSRTSVSVQIPPEPLGPLGGVRRISIRNPDGGISRPEHVARIGDAILVNVAAWRIVGSLGGGTPRSASDIASLFTDGTPVAISTAWGPARLKFNLVQPVGTITIDEDEANMWPHTGVGALDLPHDTTFMTTHVGGGVRGAINLFFVRDLEDATAYAWRGGGPIFYGEDAGAGFPLLEPTDFRQVIAHEMGHALCLQHVCSLSDDADKIDDTFFKHVCGDSDKAFLMHPNWPNGGTVLPAQIDTVRFGASGYEQGKTTLRATIQGAVCTTTDHDT